MTSGKCRYRGNLPESLSGECIKTAPKSRAGFEHENAAKLAFLGLKKATISWLQAPRNAADLRACARSKDVGFSCRTVLRHDTRGQTLYRTSLFISSKAVDRECIGPALFPRLDNSPAHTTRVWTALRVRELSGLETDAFRVDKSSICPPSSWPHSRRFFLKISIQKQPRAPSPFGRQIAVPVRVSAQGAQPRGRGSMPHARSRPRRRRDAGKRAA